MVRFYINDIEVSRHEFEKYWRHSDIGWQVDTMCLNNIKEYTKRSPYNRVCKIVVD